MTPQELENSILQLAIQGKLVEQRPEEGTGKELLEKILRDRAAETTKQTRTTGKAKVKSRVASRASSVSSVSSVPVVPPIPDDEKPFDIPDSWEWVRLGECVSNRAGLAYSRGNLDVQGAKMIRVLRGGNIADMGYCTKPDDVMISDEFVNAELFLRRNMLITPAVTSLDHVGKMARIEGDYDDMVVGGFVLMLTPHLNDDVFSRYLLCACSSKYFRDCCRTIVNKSGQAFYNLSRTKMMDQLIPLPPLAEQKRIVAKIEELLPLIDRYEKAWSKLEDFNRRFPVDMQKSLLQMAIQGKLVDHRLEEGTGKELLEKILRNRAAETTKQTRTTGKAKVKSRVASRASSVSSVSSVPVVPPIPDDEKPFDIPESWEWVRLEGLVVKEIKRGKSPVYTPRSGTLVFAQKCNTKAGAINLSLALCLDETKLKKYPESEFMKDKDIVINSTGNGTLGRVGIYRDADNPDKMPIVPDSHVTVVRVNETISVGYVLFALKYYQPFMERLGSGSTNQTELSANTVKSLPIPLPPLAEQKRIVAKLEEILPLCERLK